MKWDQMWRHVQFSSYILMLYMSDTNVYMAFIYLEHGHTDSFEMGDLQNDDA